MTKKKKLNEAPLNVWGEHLNQVKNTELSERIIELYNLEELTKDEAKELTVLLAMEKGLLDKSKERVEEIKKIMQVYYKCLEQIVGDERLITLYNVRIAEEMDRKQRDIEKPEEMEAIFKKMMEEDMDVVGHTKLKEEFDNILKSQHIEGKCDDPLCLYCSDIKEDEFEEAYDRLEEEGYFDLSTSDEQKLIQLMVTVMRLEAMFTQEEPDDEDEDDEK